VQGTPLDRLNPCPAIMTILLQNQKTGWYFQPPDTWVSNPADAHSFLSWAEATNTQQRYNLHDLQMVFKFEGESFFLEVPLECRTQPGLAG
jgi:hypothetical protein